MRQHSSDPTRLKGKTSEQRGMLVDDVVSTGTTQQGMRAVMEKAGADIVAEAATFTEAHKAKWQHIIAPGHLPVFIDGTEH